MVYAVEYRLESKIVGAAYIVGWSLLGGIVITLVIAGAAYLQERFRKPKSR